MDIDLKNQINLCDPLWVFLLALMTNVFSEFLSWMFIYRTKKYSTTKKQIDSLTKKIEESKEMHKMKDKNFEKKIKLQENELKNLNSEMMKGIVVAKLPFEPFGLLSSVSHRGILSNDKTDCSFIFLYILSNVVLRPIIQKIMGFAPPRSANQFPNFFGAPGEN